MLINAHNLSVLFQGFNASFTRGVTQAPSHYKDIAMVVPSTTRETTYGWLGQFPKMREWLGSRIVRNLAAHSYTVRNRKFEDTVAVQRDDVSDDQYGIYGPMFEEMGKAAAEHPDDLVFALLAAGFTEACYDGQYFFDTDHPVIGSDGQPASVSNMQAGSGPAWFLMDTSRAIKPLLFQKREDYVLTSLDRETDENVFMRDEYLYGVRARANAGFGLWQLAFASKADLTAANYEAARKAMQEFRGDEGRPLGIKPNVLVVPPALEGDAMRLLNNGTRVESVDDGGGGTVPVAIANEWAGTAKPIISSWLAS